MKKEHIDELLNRFLLGETTEQEEQSLAEFFRSAEGIPTGWLEMPAEWAEFAAMFRAFEIGEPSFSAEEVEGFAKPEAKTGRKLRMIRRWAAAAVVLVLLGFAWQWKAEEKERAGSTAPSVTPYEAKRSVGIADAGENSVRPGVRLHQTGAGRRGKTEAGRRGKTGAGRRGKTEAGRRGKTEAGRQARTEIESYAKAHEDSPASDNSESHQAAAYRSPAVYVMCLSDGEEDVMGECERAILEEEFQSQEERLKTVSL